MQHSHAFAIAPASRTAVAYETDDRAAILARMLTAVVPALGILAACAVMLSAIA